MITRLAHIGAGLEESGALLFNQLVAYEGLFARRGDRTERGKRLSASQLHANA
jgi:hypothetical protein